MGYDKDGLFEFVIHGAVTRGQRVILSTQEALAIAAMCIEHVSSAVGGAAIVRARKR
jgi:hypothetical protein